jgi:Ca-activated chloride channel family protein
MSFAAPAWLFALLVLPLIAAGEALLTRRDRDRVARLVSRSLWPRVVTRPEEGWRLSRLGLLLVGALGLVLALARPEWGIIREKVEREGVDVVLVLDASGSMATEDVPPSRFFLARSALFSLVSRLEGDRIGLLAFEGEAYPLVPLTLDADAVGLFLETLEPGIVPAPGSSLGVGLAKGLDMFVDKERRNKVMVLVSDGEDLEGDVPEAIRKAKEAGVVVHTVGVGTEQGQPVPDFDRQGSRVGFKKDESGSAVVSRLHPETLEAISRGTGGTYVRLSSSGASLSAVASAIEGMERKTLAREWSYRKRERYQVPLGIALASLTLAFLLPPPFPLARRRNHEAGRLAAAILAALLLGAPPARAESGRLSDEILLRPHRFTRQGRSEFQRGDHPKSLASFEKAAKSRPQDPAARFNLADALYKNGKFDEAATLYRALGADAASALSPDARFNLGNTLYQKKDYGAAVKAYKDALRLRPDDPDATRNLELALKALEDQKRQQQQQQNKDEQQKQDQQQKDQGQEQRKDSRQQEGKDQKQDQQKDRQGGKPQERPQTDDEKEQQRFRQEAGMPKERAMQLLDALQQNEKDEQKRLLAEKQPSKRPRRDW